MDIKEKLNMKLESEYKNLCDELKRKSKEEIIERAYELTVKDELKEEIKNMDLYDKEIIIMTEQKDLLDEFYHDWLDTDVPLGEALRSTIEESVAVITRYYNKQNRFNSSKTNSKER